MSAVDLGTLTPADFRRSPDDAERRRGPRTPCAGSIDILPCASRNLASFTACDLIDCSLEGVALLCPREMEVGDQFLVKFKAGKLTLLVYTVRNCRPEGDRFRIGAEFAGFGAHMFDGQAKSELARILAAYCCDKADHS